MLEDHLPELLGRTHGLQPDVEADGRLDVAMAENPAHQFVVARLVLEDDGCRSMAKLVSFLMLMDPIGSITKPIFIVIDDGRTEFDL